VRQARQHMCSGVARCAHVQGTVLCGGHSGTIGHVDKNGVCGGLGIEERAIVS
jgi:hypothetical protein